MYNIKKSIISGVIAIISMISMSITSFAYTNDYYQYHFGFSISTHGGSDYSATAVKQDNWDYASVVVETGTVSSTNVVMFSICDNDSNHTVVSQGTHTSTSNNDSFDLYYKSNVPHNLLDDFCLKGTAGYYSVSAYGYWEP